MRVFVPLMSYVNVSENKVLKTALCQTLAFGFKSNANSRHCVYEPWAVGRGEGWGYWAFEFYWYLLIISLYNFFPVTAVLREQEKNWPCYECNRRFISSEQLQQHLNSHDEKLDVFSRYTDGEGFRNLASQGPDSFQSCL